MSGGSMRQIRVRSEQRTSYMALERRLRPQDLISGEPNHGEAGRYMERWYVLPRAREAWQQCGGENPEDRGETGEERATESENPPLATVNIHLEVAIDLSEPKPGCLNNVS